MYNGLPRHGSTLRFECLGSLCPLPLRCEVCIYRYLEHLSIRLPFRLVCTDCQALSRGGPLPYHRHGGPDGVHRAAAAAAAPPPAHLRAAPHTCHHAHVRAAVAAAADLPGGESQADMLLATCLWLSQLISGSPVVVGSGNADRRAVGLVGTASGPGPPCGRSTAAVIRQHSC